VKDQSQRLEIRAGATQLNDADASHALDFAIKHVDVCGYGRCKNDAQLIGLCKDA